jgi:allantoinase
VDGPPFGYSPIVRRPRIEWPGGARVAVWVAVNVEHFPFGRPGLSIVPITAELVPDPMNHGWRDYGPRVGIWRLMDVLDAHGIRATAPIHSDASELYPDIVAAGNERDWAWMAHGKDNSSLQTRIEAGRERDYLTEVVDTLERETGRRPKGWLGPALTETFDTVPLLGELGLTYVCDWCNDDQPYPLRGSESRMISVPYSIEVNDIPLFLEKGISGPDFERLLVDQFDTLYEQGGTSGLVMAIPLHPFLVGLPFRLKYLDRALAHIAAREDVWLATGDEIADWYLERYYEEAVSLEAAPGSA